MKNKKTKVELKPQTKALSKALVLRQVFCDLRIVIKDIERREKAMRKYLDSENEPNTYKSGHYLNDTYRRDMQNLNIERRKIVSLLNAILEGKRLVRKKLA